MERKLSKVSSPDPVSVKCNGKQRANNALAEWKKEEEGKERKSPNALDVAGHFFHFEIRGEARLRSLSDHRVGFRSRIRITIL